MWFVAWLVGCPAEEGAPALLIAAPVDGTVVCGSPLHVELEVTDFVLVPLTDGTDVEPGTGHVDVYLNGQPATMVEALSFDLPEVAPGAWQLRAELVNADHTAIDPYVGDLVYVTVDPDACGS
jgi:hypothetical protein